MRLILNHRQLKASQPNMARNRFELMPFVRF